MNDPLSRLKTVIWNLQTANREDKLYFIGAAEDIFYNEENAMSASKNNIIAFFNGCWSKEILQ